MRDNRESIGGDPLPEKNSPSHGKSRGADHKPRLLFVVNVDWFFISHRLPIALEARRKGYEVHVATTITNGLQTLSDSGLIVHKISISRSDAGLLSAFRLLNDFVKLFNRVKPDLVHLVTIKPVLIGGIAARLTRVPAVVAAISGLGFIFVSDGFYARVRRRLVGFLYRFALNKKWIRVIFQNEEDAEIISNFVNLELNKRVLIPGSGVDLDVFKPEKTVSVSESKPVVIMMVARLLRDKGVVEFLQAAVKLRNQGISESSLQFHLVGAIDPDNPASLSNEELKMLNINDAVHFLGHQHNVAGALNEADIVVLPSYREGLPKVLLEAAACGKPVITTNVPGCRDAIRPGVTGLLVEPRDSESLAKAIRTLFEAPHLRDEMGRAARKLAEQSFDVNNVVTRHMQIYEYLFLGRSN